MTQTSIRERITQRGYEDYISMKKAVKSRYNETIVEQRCNIKQISTAAAVEVEDPAGETIVDIASTETTLKVYSSVADAGLQHAVITAHYKSNDGVSHTATIADAIADMSGGVDFDTPVTDFYCWDKENYTPANCFTSSLAVGVGKTLDCKDAGAVVIGRIAAGAVATTDATLLGVGQLYGFEAANQADTGYIGTCSYWTPWGTKKSGTWTFPEDSSVKTKFLDADGYTIGDFFRRDYFELDHVAIDECYLANSDGSAIYGGISIGNFVCDFSRIFVPAATEGETYLGDIQVTFPLLTDQITATIQYHAKGELLPHIESFDVGNSGKIEVGRQLEPLSEVIVKINDQNVDHGSVNTIMRWIEVEV
jgi:hypothetical protein